MTHQLASIRRMTARFAPSVLTADIKSLSPANQSALAKLIDAAEIMNEVYMLQVWHGAPALRAKLAADQSELGRALHDYFCLNGGPWSALDHNKPFIEGVPARPDHGNFYPEDLTKEEFTAWVDGLDETERCKANGFFHVIRRDADGKLKSVPYSEEYRPQLQRAATLLREAAVLTDNESLRKYLNSRAEALLSNEYQESDVDWLNLDSPIELTFGPYEVYTDEFQGFKAGFECHLALRDEVQTALLDKFTRRMQFIEDHLPIHKRYRNPKVAAAARIRVVNELLCTGMARHGVMTAAFNLPNDEETITKHGGKQVLMRNVQQAKFNNVLVPIARTLIHPSEQHLLSFEAFFTFILMHELCHALGPQKITKHGRSTTPRLELKEFYSTIEEAKADVCGLFALQLLIDEGVIPAEMSEQMYTTFVAGIFRSTRFGLNESHGKSNAMQFNWLCDKRAVTFDTATGTFKVNVPRVRRALAKLANTLLMIEAHGDYRAAKKLVEHYCVLRPRTKKAFDRLADVPVDIDPQFVLA
jgi:hypothetical protein